MKTFIKWHGNKSKHINKFIQYIPKFKGTYIEPFVGSGALFLRLEPEKWIINDLNKDLINIWNHVKDNPEEIIKEFKKFGEKFKPLSKEDKVLYCQEITKTLEEIPYDLKRASTYLLMKFCSYMGYIMIKNKFCFRGLDLHIFLNDEYFFLREKNYINLKKVNEFLNKTNGKITNKSYEKILSKAKEGDFVFLDPPYVEDLEYSFNYNKDEVIDKTFIKELYKQVKDLDKRKVKWLMTQADTKQVRTIFKEYIIKTFSVYRISSKSYKTELLIMNYTLQ